jgi:Ca-activated chloride channel family protein
MTGLRLLAGIPDSRNRVLVLVTDGQVGNEDQILNATSALLSGIRVHVVGIDQAVNAGFLGRLAAAGGGRCELVESERRLDAAMAAIQRRIAAPLVTGIRLESDAVVADSVNPRRLPDLFSGVPYVVRGRYRPHAGRQAVARISTVGSGWRQRAAARVGARVDPRSRGRLRERTVRRARAPNCRYLVALRRAVALHRICGRRFSGRGYFR